MPRRGRATPTELSAEHTAKGKLQRACVEVIRRMEAAGEVSAEKKTSDRFVYYILKQDGYPLVKHVAAPGRIARRDDQDVIDAMKHIRDAGAIPSDWISDETRDVEGPMLAPTIAEWLADALPDARINLWPEGRRPMIICESRGVRAALQATAWRYRAWITSTNGQAGGFLHTDVAPLMTWRTPVAYFGDWNPSGSMIEANTRRVLERAASELAVPLRWERLAVTPELVAAYNETHPDRPSPAPTSGSVTATRTSATSAKRWARPRLAVFIALVAFQTRAIIRSPFPGLRAIEALATSVPLFLLLFASTYVVMAKMSASNFDGRLTHTDGLYFTVTVFSTVGFGDITAKTQAARLVVTGQMLADLVILGLAIKIIVGAVNRARQPGDTDGAPSLRGAPRPHVPPSICAAFPTRR